MIDGATRLLAIVGDPIEHARSPAHINALLARSGCNAVLVPWHAPATAFTAVMQGLMLTRNVDGIVVTTPFKQRAMALADAVRPAALAAGALNALRREPDGRWTGDMFDGAGLVRAVEALGRPLAGAAVKLLGAGGAGGAIAHALAAAGVASLSIFDLDRGRASLLAAALCRGRPGCVATAGGPGLDGADLLINATPVGMRDDDGVPGALAGLTASTTVIDIVPRAGGTPLLALAGARGCRHAGGAAMVQGQAAALLEFFGFPAPTLEGRPA